MSRSAPGWSSKTPLTVGWQRGCFWGPRTGQTPCQHGIYKMRTSLGVIHARQTVLRKSITEWKQWAFLAAFSFVLPAIPAEQSLTAPATTNKVDVMDMDPEALMKITVTSVSKRPEKLSDAAAAIYVITPEDIRRSGVTSI